MYSLGKSCVVYEINIDVLPCVGVCVSVEKGREGGTYYSTIADNDALYLSLHVAAGGERGGIKKPSFAVVVVCQRFYPLKKMVRCTRV